MFNILTYNNISPIGLSRFPSEQYKVAADVAEPDAIRKRKSRGSNYEFKHKMVIEKNTNNI